VVAKRKLFWYLSMVIGTVGLYFCVDAFARSPASHEAEHGPPVATSPSLSVK
jgi:hypothetical protein